MPKRFKIFIKIPNIKTIYLDCEVLKFDSTVSSSTTRYENKSNKDNKVQINVYLKTRLITEIIEKPAITTEKLISNLGGPLSLFLGFSFLSFIELVEFFIETILYLKNKIKN